MKNGYKEIINGIERTWVACDDNSGYWIENKLKLLEDNLDRVPINCPICEIVMGGKYDTRSYLKFQCCEKCHIQFIEGREERWLAGERPSEEHINLFREKRKKFFATPLHKIDDVYIETTKEKEK